MLSAALIILLVLFVLLTIPVTLTYRLSWQRELQANVTLQWLFGLVRVRLAPPASAEQAASDEERVKDPVGSKPKRPRKKIKPLAALRLKPFRQRALRFGQDIWRALAKRDLYLRIRVGLGDPADTGQLWALCGPLSGWLANLEDASIELEPEFVDAVFELDSSGKISVIPLQLLYLVLGLMCSRPFWEGIRRMRQPA